MSDYTTQFHTDITSGYSQGGSGHVFYVDPSAAAGGNGLTEGSAWNSLDYVQWYAANIGFQPGDTILLKRGYSYDTAATNGLWLSGNGTAAQPITLGAYGNGAPPVVTNSHYVPDGNGGDSSKSDAVINVQQDASYFVIRDIKIDNPSYATGNVTDAGVRVLGTHVTIENVEITGTGTGVWFGRNEASNTGAPSDSASGTVEHCYIHDLHMVQNTVGGNDDYGCVGVTVLASDVTVIHNTFENLMQPSFDFGWDGATVEIYGSAHNVVVEGNYIENVNALTEFGGRSTDSVSNVSFDHNIIVNSESLAFFHNGTDAFALGSISNINFTSNTVYSTGNRADSTSFAFGFDGTDASFLTVENNIFSIQSLDYWSVGATNYNHSHNLYDVANVPFGPGYFSADEYQGHAVFLNAASRDFRLGSTSDALSRAVPLAGFLIDYMDHDLTGRSGLDLGAIEFWDSGTRIFGTPNADTLVGSAFADQIWGYNGDDFIDGGSGADTMYGGAGNDTYIVDNVADIVVEALGGGTDTVQSSVSYTLTANVENLVLTGAVAINGVGNSLNNQITGNSSANVLDGGIGDDVLRGGGGNDTLYGGTGNDTLQGGSGLDIFFGGLGADDFQFQSGDFSGNTRQTADWIVDFHHGQGDKIDLASVDANSGLAGDQAFTFIGNSAFTNVAGQLRYDFVTVDKVVETIVYGDTNGDGLADFAIRLTGHVFPTNGDFIL